MMTFIDRCFAVTLAAGVVFIFMKLEHVSERLNIVERGLDAAMAERMK